MKEIHNQIHNRGIFETLYLTQFYIMRRIVSFFIVCTSNIRGACVNFETLFFGKFNMVLGTPGSITIEEGCSFEDSISLKTFGTGRIKIRKNTSLNESVIICSGAQITIGEDCVIGPHVHINDTNHVFEDVKIPIRNQGWVAHPIKIEKNVWLGAGVIVLDGVNIGEGCVVGAGTIVTKDLPPWSIAVGNPAKVIRLRK